MAPDPMAVPTTTLSATPAEAATGATRLAVPRSAASGLSQALAARIVAAALGFRVISCVVAVAANLYLPHAQPDQFTVLRSPNAIWDSFARYDSGWYYQIARHGYRFVKGGPPAGVGKPGKIAFFPVYPLLMRWTGRLFGDTPQAVYLGGIVVSWVSFAAAMVALFFLARLDLSPRAAARAVLLAAIFPFSFFFGVVYTEALFLLLTALAFYGFRTRRWILAGIAGALATATRVNGILMLPSLAWIAYRTVDSDRRERALAATALAMVPAGLAAYCLYVYQLSGDPFEWVASIERWGYHVGHEPWRAPLHLIAQLATQPAAYLTTDRMAPYDTLHGLTAISFILLIPFVWRKLGAAYGVFMLLNLWLPLSSGTFEGLGRYCSVLFPAFIWLATFESAGVETALVGGFAVLYAVALSLFTTLHPIF